MIRAGLTVLVVLAPSTASACAMCLTSAYGDRSFNWAFVGFMLTPFVVLGALVGALAWLSQRSSS